MTAEAFKPTTAPGRAEGIKPTIIVDTREQAPLTFTRLPSVTGTLQSGDYSFAGCEEMFAIERKSIQDLVACCCGDNRARFERELHRLRGFRFARLLIVGRESEVTTGRYRGGVSSKAILATVAAFEARYIPVVWAGDPERAAMLVERWVWWYSREVVKQANALLRAANALPGAANRNHANHAEVANECHDAP